MSDETHHQSDPFASAVEANTEPPPAFGDELTTGDLPEEHKLALRLTERYERITSKLLEEQAKQLNKGLDNVLGEIHKAAQQNDRNYQLLHTEFTNTREQFKLWHKEIAHELTELKERLEAAETRIQTLQKELGELRAAVTQ